MTKFDPHSCKVIWMKGTMITATKNEQYVTWNASIFKPVKANTFLSKPVGDEDGQDEDLSVT